jgi:hypothetical protein
MKTEMPSRTGNGEPFTQTDLIDSAVVVATPTPQRLGKRLGTLLSVVEGFGGPYRPGTTTDVGAAIIYSLFFGALLLFDAGRLSVDALIERRLRTWHRIAELS